MDEFTFPAIHEIDHAHVSHHPFPEPTAAAAALRFYSPEPGTSTRLWRSSSAASSPRGIRAPSSPVLSDYVCSELEESIDKLWEDLNEELRRPPAAKVPAGSPDAKLQEGRRRAPAAVFDLCDAHPSLDAAVVKSTGGARRRRGLAFVLRSLKQLFVARKAGRHASSRNQNSR